MCRKKRSAPGTAFCIARLALVVLDATARLALVALDATVEEVAATEERVRPLWQRVNDSGLTVGRRQLPAVMAMMWKAAAAIVLKRSLGT
jgi:hypothetical protein